MKIKKILAAVLSLTLLCGTGGILPTANAQNLGDVNNDSVIDSSDATVILIDYANSLLGRASTLDKSIADCNGDGSVDSSDATVILIAYANALLGGKTLTTLDGSSSSSGSSSGGTSGGQTQSIKSAYQKILNIEAEKEEGLPAKYYIWDINESDRIGKEYTGKNGIYGDGIPELITCTGMDEARSKITFYTYENGKAVKIGEIRGWHTDLYNAGDDDLVAVTTYAGMEEPEETLTKIVKSGNSIITTEMYSGTQRGNTIDYYSGPELEICDASDLTVLNRRFQ